MKRENAGVEGRRRGAKSDVEERQSRGLRRGRRGWKKDNNGWEGGEARVEAGTEKRRWLKRNNERS